MIALRGVAQFEREWIKQHGCQTKSSLIHHGSLNTFTISRRERTEAQRSH